MKLAKRLRKAGQSKLSSPLLSKSISSSSWLGFFKLLLSTSVKNSKNSVLSTTPSLFLSNRSKSSSVVKLSWSSLPASLASFVILNAAARVSCNLEAFFFSIWSLKFAANLSRRVRRFSWKTNFCSTVFISEAKMARRAFFTSSSTSISTGHIFCRKPSTIALTDSTFSAILTESASISATLMVADFLLRSTSCSASFMAVLISSIRAVPSSCFTFSKTAGFNSAIFFSISPFLMSS
mmetsp:Transcript_89950/g.160081  ORF Transcript_89950/g.160081 Transcript_89950/m.160081 type:complete len:237 (-) Transcript_89950:1040-1750(-)